MFFSTKDEVLKAIKELTGSPLGEHRTGFGRGEILVYTLAEYVDAMAARGYQIDANAMRTVQAQFDPKSRCIVMLADNIKKGRETAVLAHELVHKHGLSLLDQRQWRAVITALKEWRQVHPFSLEHQVYQFAHSMAQRSVHRYGRSNDETDNIYEEELFAYAVEACVKAGVNPNDSASINQISGWLARANSVISKIVESCCNGRTPQLQAEDFVALAFALGHIERNGHADAFKPPPNHTQGQPHVENPSHDLGMISDPIALDRLHALRLVHSGVTSLPVSHTKSKVWIALLRGMIHTHHLSPEVLERSALKNWLSELDPDCMLMKSELQGFLMLAEKHTIQAYSVAPTPK